MNFQIDSSERFPDPDSSAIKVTIIYEDFASGIRAKNFTERLAEQLGCTCHLSDSFWRSDLLECPPIAAEAAAAAADSDYIIISLDGDHVLPFATRRWIEAHLNGASVRCAGLIALVNSGRGNPNGETWRAGGGARHHLRSACAVKNVPFFCHAVMASPDDAITSHPRTDDTAEHELLGKSWTPGWSHPVNVNDYRHGLVQRR